MSKYTKSIMLMLTAILCVCAGSAFAAAAAAASSTVSGIGTVAGNITGNLENLAKLITAGAYVAGFGFAVAAIVKFKAHKDNPTQIPISMPIVLLFVGIALVFIPSVLNLTGKTMFGATGVAGKISGITNFTSGGGAASSGGGG